MFSDYWLHNKGPAPTGYQPVSVQIGPGRMSGPGPFTVPVTVASSRTDGNTEGIVTVVTPPGWSARPAERPFSLAPGSYLAFETTVTAASDAADGRYFVAARIEDEAGQVHEDILTIDRLAAGETAIARGRSPSSQKAMDRTTGRPVFAVARAAAGASLDGAADVAHVDRGDEDLAGELEVELVTAEVRVSAGERAELRVLVRNRAADEIRGEAQLISPHETWPITTPWTQGFAVGAGAERTLTFAVHPPSDFVPGTFWGLVKVMYFGRLWYTPAALIEVVGRT